MDAVLLARIQFALTIAFHFFFPPINIGLSYFLVYLEGRGFLKKDPAYENMGKFFGKIFAIAFAVGAGTGIVMSFQFGTNWGEFTKYVNNVFGSFLAIEIIFAFFIESAFLGIYLLGRGRVPKWLHWMSIIMVSLGATMSAFWIMGANSWMQTPSGIIIKNGMIVLKDFWQAVFSPSFLYRLFHTLVASILTAAFLVSGILAYFVLTNKNRETSGSILKTVIVFTFIVSILQVVPFGHQQVVELDKNQKVKLATIEGVYESGSHVPFVLFTFPHNNPPYFNNVLQVPGLLSYMFDLSGNHHILGLKDVAPGNIPPVALTFIAFHTMVYIGVAMIALMGFCLFLIHRKKLFTSKLFLTLLIVAIPLPTIATQLGWITSEVGRQPWIIYKILKTADAVSVTVGAGQILFSIILMSSLYLILFALFIYLLVKTVRKGPEPESN